MHHKYTVHPVRTMSRKLKNLNGSPGRARSDLPVGPSQRTSGEGGSDCGSGRYYFVVVSKSFAVRGMVQCGEGFGMRHCLLMGGIDHISLLGGAFHRLLIDGIDQNTGAELTTFLCSTYRAAVFSANTAGDKASRAGNIQATMMLCCFDFFIYLPLMTACRAYIA